MNKDELQSKISDLITDVTIDPSGESIVATVREIMNLVDEYEHSHEHVESMKPAKFLFSFKTMKNGVQNGYFKRIYATGKTREDAEWEAKVEVYTRSRVWPDEIILLECKELV